MSNINNQNIHRSIHFSDLPEEVIQSEILERLEPSDRFNFALTSLDNAQSVGALHNSLKTRAITKLEALKTAAGTLDELIRDVSDNTYQLIGDRPGLQKNSVSQQYQPFSLHLETWTEIDQGANYLEILGIAEERHLDLLEALCELPLESLKAVEEKLKNPNVGSELSRQILKEAMSTAKGAICIYSKPMLRFISDKYMERHCRRYDYPKGTVNLSGPYVQCKMFNSESSNWSGDPYYRLRDFGFPLFVDQIPVQRLIGAKEGERFILKLPSQKEGCNPQVIFRPQQKSRNDVTFEVAIRARLKSEIGYCHNHWPFWEVGGPREDKEQQKICEQNCQDAWTAAQKALGIEPESNNNNN